MLIVLVFISLFWPVSSNADDAWWNESWEKRLKITFDNSSRTENLVSFPALVSLDSNIVTYASFLDGGADIRFVDADGATELYYEIEKWDSTATSTLWVKIPQIDASSATDYIYMYYNNTGASASTSPADVWNSGYIAVHHFNETTDQYIDSTSNNNDSDSVTSVTRNYALGSIGNSGAFVGGNGNSYVTIPDSATFDMSNYTLEAYVNQTGAGTAVSSGSGGTSVYPIISKGIGEGETVVADVQFLFGLTTSNLISADFENDRNLGGTSQNIPTTGATALTNGVWYHSAVIFDNANDTWRTYKDGVRDSNVSTTYNPSTGGTQKVGIGTGRNTTASSGGFNGRIDELRISNIARSENWVSASASSTANTLNIYGTEEPLSSEPDTTPPTIISVSSNTVAGTYYTGQTIDIRFQFSENVTSTGSVSVTFDTGGTCSFTVSNSSLGTCNYVVGLGETSLDLNTTDISGSIADGSSNPMENLTPATNLAENESLVIAEDVISPTFSAISASVASSTATVTWTTNEDASSQVEYGTTESYGQYSTYDSDPTQSHSVSLSGLTASTTYYFKVASSDVAGNTASSTGQSFTTLSDVFPFGDELILYRFEEGNTTVTNSGTGGASYNSEMYNGGAGVTEATTTAKVGNYAVSFDETQSYIDTKYGTGINPSSQSLSFSMWYYKKEASAGCNSGDDDHFLGVSGPSANTRLYLRCTNGYIGFRLGGNSAVNLYTLPAHRAWYNFVFVLNASTDIATLYVNGNSVATGAIPSFSLGDTIYIGNFHDRVNNTYNEGSNASIDDFAIYTRALSAAETSVIYNSVSLSSSPTGLSATALQNSVALSWTAPSLAEGIPDITDYIVEYKLSADSIWTAFNDGISSTVSTTVTGLSDGSAYDFRVSSVNTNGTSEPTDIVSSTPTEVVSFTSTNPADGATLPTSALSISASSTLSTGSYFAFTLRDGDNNIASSSVSTRRTGYFNLESMDNVVDNTNLSLTANTSGITYATTSKTLFVIHNDTGTIDELNLSGSLIRSITCSSCGDTEGITLISSAETAGGYNHSFMISTEGTSKLFRVLIGPNTTSVNATDSFALGLGDQENLGIEGVAYDETNDIYYAVKEKTPLTIYQIDVSSGSAVVTEICNAPTLFSGVATDLSDVDYSETAKLLFVSSHESAKIMAVDISNPASCSIVSSIATGQTQTEGVAFDEVGDYLYAIGEADYFSVWRVNDYEGRNTYSNLSNGNYTYTISLTDASSNTYTSPSRSVTISVDATLPTISSITSETVDGTYGIGNEINATVNFSENVTSTGSVTLTFDTGDQCSFSVSGSSSGTCSISVSDGDSSDDLTVTLVSGTIIDTQGNQLNNFSPVSNLNVSKNIVVDGVKPIVSGVTASSSPTMVDLSWNTNEEATSYVRYGATNSYGTETSPSEYETSHEISLTGLSADTTYHFQIIATDAVSNATSTSDSTFTTSSLPDTTAPIISSVTSSPSQTSVSITWTTNELASSRVQYGVVSTYNRLTPITDTAPRMTSHTVLITGLKTCTLYYFRVISQDASSNSKSGNAETFTTTGCVGLSTVEQSTVDTASTLATSTISMDTGSGGLTLTVPPSYSDSSAVFQIKKMDDGLTLGETGIVSGKTALTGVYNLQAYTDESNTITTFNEPITITIEYSDSNVANIDESSLKIYRYDGSNWNELSNCSVNTSANTVTCVTTAFSTFAIFGETTTSASSVLSTNSGNGPVFSSSTGSIQGIPTSRLQTVYSDGTIKYWDENLSPSNNLNQSQKIYAYPIINRSLVYGSSGEDVKKLQLYLANDPKIYPEQTISGWFGPATLKAVKKFQEKFGIAGPDNPGFGIVGPKTINMIKILGNATEINNNPTTSQTTMRFSKPLKKGMSDPEVKTLQAILNRDKETAVSEIGPGSQGEETNYFGAMTLKAVQRFQIKHKIADYGDAGLGLVGPVTRNTLNGLIEKTGN